ERGEPRPLRRNAGAKEKIGYARLHLFGGFVGEGHRENIFSRDAIRNEIRHAKGDGARFAGSCAGKNQQRAFRGFRGKTLFWVQLAKEREHWFRSRNVCVTQLC